MKKSLAFLSSMLLVVLCLSMSAFAQETKGDLQGYVEDSGYVEPIAAPQAVPEPLVEESTVVQLPSTGTGSDVSMLLAAGLAGIAAVVSGGAALRRRLTG